MFYYQSKEQSSFRVMKSMLFLSYVQRKPSDESNQLLLKFHSFNI